MWQYSLAAPLNTRAFDVVVRVDGTAQTRAFDMAMRICGTAHTKAFDMTMHGGNAAHTVAEVFRRYMNAFCNS